MTRRRADIRARADGWYPAGGSLASGSYWRKGDTSITRYIGGRPTRSGPRWRVVRAVFAGGGFAGRTDVIAEELRTMHDALDALGVPE